MAVAEHLLASGTRFVAAITFHCQQAVEKYLKALLTWWDVDFPKTHILAVLVKLVARRDAELAETLMDVISLTPYAVQLRYPGDLPHISAAEARQAVLLAQKTRDAVLPLLP